MRAGRVIAAVALAASLVGCGDAQSACAPSDVIGKWHVTLETVPYRWYTPAYAAIDARGGMNGLIRVMDRSGIDGWSIKSVTPIKVDAACTVSGQFALTYPVTENRGFAFAKDGAVMSRDKNRITGIAFANPGYDTLPIEYATIRVSMERRP